MKNVQDGYIHIFYKVDTIENSTGGIRIITSFTEHKFDHDFNEVGHNTFGVHARFQNENTVKTNVQQWFSNQGFFSVGIWKLMMCTFMKDSYQEKYCDMMAESWNSGMNSCDHCLDCLAMVR
jgi:hypothetical protein